MARSKLLPSVLIAISVIIVTQAAFANSTGCSPQQVLNGTCTVSVDMDDEKVTLGVDTHVPGGAGGPGGGPAVSPPPDGCLRDRSGMCRDTYDAVAAVTLSDIAHFRPTPGRNLMEPDGWMIVGLHTNFYAHANRHVVTGELRGEHAWVRFTPVGYRWWYGDGTTHYSTNPGNTWRILGLGEFDRTPNSHVYQAPGTYFIDLSIVFRAEYRYAGDSFIPIAGTITVPANRLVAVAGDAVTVLVEDDCTRNPRGPGC